MLPSSQKTNWNSGQNCIKFRKDRPHCETKSSYPIIYSPLSSLSFHKIL